MFKYTVYDKRTDMPVAIYETAYKCASAMGIKASTFYTYIIRPNNRWEIHKHRYVPKPIPKSIPKFTDEERERMAVLPDMARASAIANALNVTVARVLKLCGKYNVPIILAGRRPIKIISRDKFIEEVMNHESKT